MNCVSLVNNLNNNSPGGWVVDGNTYTYSPKYSPRQKEVYMKDIKDIHITIENGKLEVYIDGEKLDLSAVTDMRIDLSLKSQVIEISREEVKYLR